MHDIYWYHIAKCILNMAKCSISQLTWCVADLDSRDRWKVYIVAVKFVLQCARAGTSNYILQIMWDVITCHCSWYLMLVRKSSFITIPGEKNNRYIREHYGVVILGALASQTTGVSVVCLTVCSGFYERKHQSSASLAFVGGIHRWPANPLTKGQWRENVSIWWRHHEGWTTVGCALRLTAFH